MDSSRDRGIRAFTVTGGILLLVGAAVHITGWEYAPLLFAVGTFLFSIGQFADRYEGDDLILKRLRSQQLIGTFFIILTALLMFSGGFRESVLMNNGMNPKMRNLILELTNKNNWIVTLTIAALFELFPAFRMDSRIKELDKTKED